MASTAKAFQYFPSETIRATLSAEPDPAWRLRWLFYFHTGLRSGDCETLRWDWIDWQGQILCIPTEKNGAARTLAIPLHPDLFKALKEFRQRTPHANTGGILYPVSQQEISGHFKKLSTWELPGSDQPAFRKAMA